MQSGPADTDDGPRLHLKSRDAVSEGPGPRLSLSLVDCTGPMVDGNRVNPHESLASPASESVLRFTAGGGQLHCMAAAAGPPAAASVTVTSHRRW